LPSSSSSSRHCTGNANWHFINAPTANANIQGLLQVGDNSSAAGGTPEFALSGSPNVGQLNWISSLINGFDSSAAVSLNARGGIQTNASWWVGGGAIYADVSFTAVNSVQIVAKAKNGCKLTFSNIVISFYKNGQVTETITIPDECCPVADPLTQVLEIVPTADDNTGVVVQADVRLQGPGTTLPASDDITGTIGIFTH